MSFSINNYTFEGPFNSTHTFDNQAGIFAIICSKNEKLYLVDIGELLKGCISEGLILKVFIHMSNMSLTLPVFWIFRREGR